MSLVRCPTMAADGGIGPSFSPPSPPRAFSVEQRGGHEVLDGVCARSPPRRCSRSCSFSSSRSTCRSSVSGPLEEGTDRASRPPILARASWDSLARRWTGTARAAPFGAAAARSGTALLRICVVGGMRRAGEGRGLGGPVLADAHHEGRKPTGKASRLAGDADGSQGEDGDKMKLNPHRLAHDLLENRKATAGWVGG